MLNALDYNVEDWVQYLSEINEPKFRAKQIFTWLQKGVSFRDMTNLPKKLQENLANNFEENSVKIHKKLISSKDGTRKYIFALQDGNIIEGVFMSYKYGNTISISTQVGCRMNCAFCASGLDGLVRNL
ncbi:MAG: 23S rRNA (adenine(2503)-C(2))-methyltransferase RlmN, partial [Clostridia bacterium]|nr:23S rRNA (adenine(2503)-C(2))-methyltransferase RlmN [Clostridia bacterium]